MKDAFDFHVHTNRSDAAPDQSPQVVCQAAQKAGLQHLAITDHDRLLSAPLRRELCESYQLDVISGCEFNARLTLKSGKAVTAHIIGNWLPADDPPPVLKQVIKTNQTQDFHGYVTAMFEKLLRLGIDPSGCGDTEASFRMASALYPDSTHLGKNAVAHTLVKTGLCSSAKEAKDKYLSSFGAKLAYVSSSDYFQYAPMESVMQAANLGISVLCHLYYYQLSDEENLELISRFKDMGGQALEVNYGFYGRTRQAELLRLCRKFELLPTAASDRHEGTSSFKIGDPAWFYALRRRCLELHREG